MSYSTGMPIELVLYDMMFGNYVDYPDDMDIWVIGDVHGCTDEYRTILNKIRDYSNQHEIYQLGDLIDRGSGLYDIMLLSKEFNVKHCVGNHEINFIQERMAGKYCRSRERRKTHERFDLLSEKEQDELMSFFLDMKNSFYVHCRTGLWGLSHAPMKLSLSLLHDCGNAANYCMGNTPYPEESVKSGIRYVHGHQHWNYTDIHEQIDNENQNWYNVDSGVVYDNKLTAMNIKNFDLIQVNSMHKRGF